jgi:hypothetical protein
MHVKEIYFIFIHLFDSGILLIIDLNKKKGKKGEIINSDFLFKINLIYKTADICSIFNADLSFSRNKFFFFLLNCRNITFID